MGFLDKLKNKISSDDSEDNIENKQIDIDQIVDDSVEECGDNVSCESIEDSSEDKFDFNYLQKLVLSSKNIKLEHDITLGIGEEIDFKNGIHFRNYGEEMIFDGNGHTIDARGKTRIFDFFGERVIIKNTILKNGYANGDGGAIRNRTFSERNFGLTLENCILTNNFASDLGGAISNEGHIKIINCTLSENKARIGGAIFNSYAKTGSKCMVNKSMFTKNISEESGDVLYNDDFGEFLLTDSIFEKNMTINSMIVNYLGRMRIDKCEFYKNDSWGSSHLILNFFILEISNSIFKDNTSCFMIFNDDRSLSIYNVRFFNNVVTSVICNTGYSLNIDKSVFKNNFSSDMVATNILNKAILTLKNICLITDEITIYNNGKLIIRSESLEIEKTIGGEGEVTFGMQDLNMASFSYLDSQIHESDKKLIELENDIYLDLIEIEFFEGGIELDIDNLIIDGKGHVIDGFFSSRIFIITGKNITLKNIIFKGGHSFVNYEGSRNSSGGALKIYPSSEVMIENCKFIENISELKGGAIQNYGKSSIFDSELTKNRVEPLGLISFNHGGGAISNEGELTIRNTILNKNSISEIEDPGLTWGGGAIVNGGKLSIYDSTLTENKIYYLSQGGAILNYGDLNTFNCTFRNNKPDDVF